MKTVVIVKRLFLILMIILSLSPYASGATYLMIIEGINKDVDEIQSKDRAVLKLQKAATQKFHVSHKNSIILSYKGSLVTNTNGLSTAETIKLNIRSFSEKIRPTDRFILYYLGQANAVKGTLRLNLPGPDITGEHLAKWIEPIKTSNMLIIVDCPNAGLVVKHLARSGRIILVSSRADQPYSPRFCEYFIPAIIASESDINHDGKISLMETLQQTARRLDQFYLDRDQVKHENFLLEDDGDGVPNQQPWLYHENKTDGLIASKYFWKG
jgi:hypothetical protein